MNRIHLMSESDQRLERDIFLVFWGCGVNSIGFAVMHAADNSTHFLFLLSVELYSASDAFVATRAFFVASKSQSNSLYMQQFIVIITWSNELYIAIKLKLKCDYCANHMKKEKENNSRSKSDIFFFQPGSEIMVALQSTNTQSNSCLA